MKSMSLHNSLCSFFFVIFVRAHSLVLFNLIPHMKANGKIWFFFYFCLPIAKLTQKKLFPHTFVFGICSLARCCHMIKVNARNQLADTWYFCIVLVHKNIYLINFKDGKKIILFIFVHQSSIKIHFKIFLVVQIFGLLFSLCLFVWPFNTNRYNYFSEFGQRQYKK